MPISTFQADWMPSALVAQAKDALNGAGLVILRHAVEPGALEEAGRAVVNDFCGVSADIAKQRGVRVGDGRYMATLDLAPPFDNPAIFASAPLLALVRATLGVDAIINSLTVVIALPGAQEQRPHVDHGVLFPGDEAASMSAPPYALTAIMPLLDLTSSTGSTEVWQKGKLMPTPDRWETNLPGSVVLPLSLGDVGIMDYRVCHRGTPNTGAVPRPILYIVYSRPWFRDSENFSEIPPLRVSREQLANLPAQYRALFATAAAGHLV